MKHLVNILLLALGLSVVVFGQPQGGIRTPLDGPIALSATFAEVRTGHFHAGIDMRTGGVTGKPVYAAADGYVCGVRISPWGGGKMLYIQHADGYMSVYMHLDGYAGDIARYVLNEQYKEEAYAIVRDVPEGLLPVKKGQQVAISGNTGGSGGPHLHFEMRKEGRTINPLHLGLPYTDHIRPVIRGINVYQSDGKVLPLGQAGSVTAGGRVYLGVYATDAAEGSTPKNGPDRIEVYVDGRLFFCYTTEAFPLEENSRTSNALIDFPHYSRTRQPYILTRGLPGAEGEWVPVRADGGYIDLKPGQSHKVQVRVYDVADNLAERSFTLVGGVAPTATAAGAAGVPVAWNRASAHDAGRWHIELPAGALYTDDELCLARPTAQSLDVQLRNSPLPPHLWYTLSVESPRVEGAVMLRTTATGKPTAYRATYDGCRYTARVRDFGTFSLGRDSVPPKLRPINFSTGKPLTSTTLKVGISDDLSGIDTYRCTLNGKWVLAEYDGKTAMLVVNASGRLQKGRNELRCEVTDVAGNRSVQSWTLMR